MPGGLTAVGCNGQGCSDPRLHSSLASAWSWHGGQVPPSPLQHRGWVVLSGRSSVGPPMGPPRFGQRALSLAPSCSPGLTAPPLASSGLALTAPHCHLPRGCPVRGCPYTTCANLSTADTVGHTSHRCGLTRALQEVWQ